MVRDPDTPRAKGKATPAVRPLARGFVQAGALLGKQVIPAGERRGFAEVRLLTHWAEIAGDAVAAISRPLAVRFSKGFGATLVLQTSGAHAPELQMQLPALRDRANACYGYNAIARIRLEQAPLTGMAEEPEPYRPGPPDPAQPVDAPGLERVADSGLRQALESLARNLQSRKPTQSAGKTTA
jgi:hypothetical protein